MKTFTITFFVIVSFTLNLFGQQPFSVQLSSTNFGCGVSQVSAISNCSFNGSVSVTVLNTPLGIIISNVSNVVAGNFTFNMEVTPAAPIFSTLQFSILTTDNPTGCPPPGAIYQDRITVDCVCNIVLDHTLTHESCYMCNNGSALAIVSGGSSPYTYLWSNGSVSPNSGPVAPGIYYVQVTDDDLCTTWDTIAINPYVCPGFTIVPVVGDVLCFGECNGIIDLILSNGSQSFQALWADGNTENSREDLCEGTYTLTVIDADNCTASDSVEIFQPELFSLGEISVVSSEDGDGGMITINYTGGQGQIDWFINGNEYNLQDSMGVNQKVFSNLEPACYKILGIDENGCELNTDSICVENISAISDLRLSELLLIPNPAMDEVYLKNLDIQDHFSLNITNTSGIVIYKSQNERTLNISTLASGIYFVTVTTNQGIYSQKLIKI
jgi:Secretion system C-terminal sorting domain/SprB repeat